jgi:hypothetical protein
MSKMRHDHSGLDVHLATPPLESKDATDELASTTTHSTNQPDMEMMEVAQEPAEEGVAAMDFPVVVSPTPVPQSAIKYDIYAAPQGSADMSSLGRKKSIVVLERSPQLLLTTPLFDLSDATGTTDAPFICGDNQAATRVKRTIQKMPCPVCGRMSLTKGIIVEQQTP